MSTMHSTTDMGVTSVPAFLTKIWTLVEDPTTDEFIAWDSNGTSFHVFDQARFAKEVLPLYFKHNNMASFIRQLNMYGFRKVVHVDNGSMKQEVDDVEFYHTYFQRGREELLEHIKRKQSAVGVKSEPGIKLNPDDVSRVLSDVHLMKGKQDTITNKMDNLKKENEALWREVASLRQKHMKQQQIVNKLIQFMVHLVGGNRELANNMKRKMPLMINDSSQVTSAKKPKYSKQLSIEEIPETYVVNSPSNYLDQNRDASGPIIHDVTELLNAPTNPGNATDTMSPQGGAVTSSTPVVPTSHTVVAGSNGVSLTSTAPTTTTATTTGAGPLPLTASFNSTMSDSSDLLGTTLDSADLSSLVDYGLLPATSTEESSGQLDRLIKDLPKGQNPTIQVPTELFGELDNMQDDLDYLKNVLSTGQYGIDTNTLMDLFQVDTPVRGNIMGDDRKEEKQLESAASGTVGTTSDPGTITGNELVSYNYIPPDMLLSPLTFPDLSDIGSGDSDGMAMPVSVESDYNDPQSLFASSAIKAEDDLNLD